MKYLKFLEIFPVCKEQNGNLLKVYGKFRYRFLGDFLLFSGLN